MRLLSVAQFGRYREFLLYVGLLSALAAFGINNSLLYFVPARPRHAWRFVRQSVLLTALNSLAGAVLLVALDSLSGGALVGEYLWPVTLYVLLFVNVDFWEFLWLALKRPGAVFAYTSGRLLARMTVVIVAATLAADVDVIIASLIALEAARFAISMIAWRRVAQEPEEAVAGSWREQLRFCMPVGVSLVLVTLNKSAAGIFIAKAMGPIALAHYTIGTYLQPVITVLRNSISDALLPEMAASSARQDSNSLDTWRRTTVMSAVLLLPAAVLLARFAEPLVVLLFSASYAAAIPVLQIYSLVLVRECFDFGVPLRAINRTAPIVGSNLTAIGVNLMLLFMLVPVMGLTGAVWAFVVSRFVDCLYLARRTTQLYGVRVRELACWGDLARVVVATACASIAILAVDWTQRLGVWGLAPALLLFAVCFVLALRLLRLPEAMRVFERLRPLGARS